MTARLREYHVAYAKSKTLLTDWYDHYEARSKELEAAKKELERLQDNFDAKVDEKAKELAAEAEKVKAEAELAKKEAKEKAETTIRAEVVSRLKVAVNHYLDTAPGRKEHQELAMSWMQTDAGKRWFAEESYPAFDLGQKSLRDKILDRNDSYDVSWMEEFLGPVEEEEGGEDGGAQAEVETTPAADPEAASSKVGQDPDVAPEGAEQAVAPPPDETPEVRAE